MKSEQMTSRERLIAAIEGKPVDRIPFSPVLAYLWEHFPEDVKSQGELAFLQEIGADPLWRGYVSPVTMSTPGVEVKTYQDGNLTITETITPVGSLRHSSKPSETGNTVFLMEHPLKTEEDFKVQLWIEEHTKIMLADQEPVEEITNREGLAIGMYIHRGKTAFQSLIEHYVGTVELTYALCDFPETVEALWEAMVQRDLESAKLATESAFSYFLTWEDSSTQNYSPAMYEKYIAPEIKQFCEIAKAAGKSYIQHACGHVKDLVVSMRDCGVKAIESVSSPPTGNISIKEVREKIGPDMGIIGGIEPIHFLTLSLEELGPYVEQVIEEASGGPFILANSDSCPPGVTIEKFKLAADIARGTRL